MKTRNPSYDRPLAVIKGRVSAKRAGTAGVTFLDAAGNDVTSPDVQFIGATVSGEDGELAIVTINGSGSQVVNDAGADLQYGDVVVQQADGSVTTTTTAQNTGRIGVVQIGGSDGDPVSVVFQGDVAQINTTASVTAGNYAETSTVAGQATENATARSGSFGKFLGTGTNPPATLFGQTYLSGGGSGGGGGVPSWFNVQDSGAVGDGTTDDTLAIQGVIDAACVAGGGIVYFPAGTYLISSEASGARYGIRADCSNVTLMGDGMFSSVLDFDSAQTLPGGVGTEFIPVEIGTATAGVTEVEVRDLAVIGNMSTLGDPDSGPYIQGIAASQSATTSAHSDDITLRRVRVVDVNAGIFANKGGSNGSARTASRHQRWTVDGCLVDTTLNKAIELSECEDSAILDCLGVNCQDGLQFLNYTARSVMARNRVQYKDGGINLTEGLSDIEVYENECAAIAGGGIQFTGGIVIRRESFAATGPTSSRVKIHDNLFNDTLNDGGSVGIRFATYSANTGVGTFADYEIYGNSFVADDTYLYDTEFAAKSQAVRLRVYDNHFTGDVHTSGSWVSDRTRLERNQVGGALTIAANNWDLRGNVVAGTVTLSGTGYTLDDGYVRNVLVSATPPTAGQALIASSATAAAWGSVSVTAADLIALGLVGPILIADDHSTPLVFADLIQTEEGDDLLYADIGG